ncbi:MAG: hypothetical protein GX254_00930 [Clostridiales bacterium]|nr:hypothetical protein [Clostridiales bacterium]
MKKHLKRVAALLLILVITCSFMQLSVFAASNELVITKIGHADTNTVSITSSSTRAITLTVPYGYVGDTLDLSTQMTIEKASGISTFIHYFDSPVATVNGPAVKMTVEYTRNNNTTDSTEYSITVKRSAMKKPTYSGTISMTVASANLTAGSNDILFTLNDLTKGVYTPNDGRIDAFAIKGSNLACGTLKYLNPGTKQYENYEFNTKISLENVGSLAFDAVTSGTVTYKVVAYYGNTEIGSANLNITVKSIGKPTISSAISKSVPAGSTVTFTKNDFLGRCNLNGGELKNIIITPGTTDKGIWYDGTKRIIGSATFTPSTIQNLKFTAYSTAADSSVSFTWEVSNEAGYSTPGHGVIHINNISVPTIVSTISKTADIGDTVAFSLSDFNNRINLNNGTLEHIEITPVNSGYGTWYNGLTPFTSPTVFTPSTIGSLRFVAGTAGTATFTWRVSNESGFSSTGTGSILISESGGMTYTTLMNTPVSFEASDFYADFYNSTGQMLSYVKFSLPQPYYGTLYYDYSPYRDNSPVTADTAYYVSSLHYGSKLIDKISFVPAADYTGIFTIAYTGYSSSGMSALGFIHINVASSGIGTTNHVTYSTAINTPVRFDSSRFKNVFLNTTGKSLSYVTFTLPSPIYGALYYNYGSSSQSLVSENTSYYTSYSSLNRLLNNVTFVPSAGFSGKVTISYTGYTNLGIPYDGYIEINVGTSGVSDSGHVSYNTAKNSPVNIRSIDLYNAFSRATGKELAYVYFTQPSTSAGTLYYSYSSSTQDLVTDNLPYFISIPPYLDLVTFVPATNFTGTVAIRYMGYSTDGTSLNGTIQINIDVSASTGTVTYNTAKNTAATFNSNDIVSSFYSTTGTELTYVFFTIPSPSEGTLYYGSVSSSRTPVKATTAYFVNSAPFLDYVTFVPASNFSGTVTITYTGFDKDGNPSTGYIRINVGSSGTGLATVTYNTAKNSPVTFSATDIASAFQEATGNSLSYVLFTLPSSSTGTLYHNYSSVSNRKQVSSTTPYFVNNAPYLNYVTFVPAMNYTGTVTITYTGFDVNGSPKTGYIDINVGTTGTSSITYNTPKNTPITLKSEDLVSAFEKATGTNLNYVYFKLPSSSAGTLYYNYENISAQSPVSETSPYFVGFPPFLDYVTFVPAANYSGTVRVSYTGYDTDGNQASGIIQINVGSADMGTISYYTAKNTPVTLKARDLNTVFSEANKVNLSYVYFSLPPSAAGKLYYSYSSTSTQNPVTESTPYFTSVSPSIDSVTFVPAANYTGIVTINYTGYSANGYLSARGTIQITVGSGQSSVCELKYTTEKNKAVTFKEQDFNKAFSAATGLPLKYVKFTLPKATSGTMYYNYISTSVYNTAVTASSQYNVDSSPYLSYITFVPAKDYVGTVSISFTGYAADGTSCSGTVKIEIKSTGPNPFTDLANYSWAKDAIDYLYNNGIIIGTGGNKFSPGSYMKRGDFILMLYRAFGFTSDTQSSFIDVPKDSYYYDAINAAKALGITNETGKYFYPEVLLTRQDAMYYTYRALQVSGSELAAGSPSDIAEFKDKNEISDYAVKAVQALVKSGVIKGTDDFKLNPLGNLRRAEMAVILHRALTV